MNELNIQMTAEQLSLYKALRAEYAKQMREIANIKEFLKGDIDAFFDKMGYDKEDKEAKKAIKKSLAMYAKQNASEEQNVVNEAATLASL